MNITFLIGNGFDLNIGLRTTYSAFLEQYTKPSDEESELIKYFKKSIKKDAKLWSDAEKAFGAATQRFLDETYTGEDFCACHEDFCLGLAEYLVKEERKLDYKALDDKLATEFAKSILNFQDGFREIERQAINTSVQGVGGQFSFRFISFNYTAVLDHCCKAVIRKKNLGYRYLQGRNYENVLFEPLHVHGTVSRDMVLGVNDLAQISAPALFDGYDEEYINQLIKNKTNEMNGDNNDTKAYSVLRGSDLIYIYGMSIGETDALWWERICKLLEEKKDLHVIIHRYDAPEEGLIRRRYLSYVKKVKKDFADYSAWTKEKEENISGRIHIVKANIFSGLEGLVEASTNVSTDEMTVAAIV